MSSSGGRGSARDRLVRELRAAKRARGITAAELARLAGVSESTVSNTLNGRTNPSQGTLDQLAGALGIQARELHALRDRAVPLVRRLEDYLQATDRAAREHPYPGVVPGVIPPLAAIYVRQDAVRITGAPRDGIEARRAADDVLDGSHNCVVMAGPGGGKSSLLRSRLAAAVGRWQDDRGGSLLPVIVSAGALADMPIARALAEAVSADLSSFGLVGSLNETFFDTPPQPGAMWWVMIDDLDEVADPVARRRVLRMVSAIPSDRFRFTVATRPLPAGELDVLGDVARYELMPFAAGELATVAQGWFRALGMPDPAQAAAGFAAALRSAQVADLARVPLMISMLCQLHALEPHRPLPSGRTEVYERFVGLLHERQYPAGPVTAPLASGVQRFGLSAVAHAEVTVTRLKEIVSALAAQRRAGSQRPALAIVESLPEAAKAPTVPPADWQQFLASMLRRSGLLAERGGDFYFLHQTLLEFLAACHLTRNPDAAAATLHGIFHNPDLLDLIDGAEQPYLNPPEEDPSYLGFVIDLAQRHAPALLAPHLERLASAEAGLFSNELIVDLARLGTQLPAGVGEAARRQLLRAADDQSVADHVRLNAALALGRAGDHRAFDVLSALARDSAERGHVRRQALDGVLETPVPRVFGLLADLIGDSTLDSHSRQGAVAGLVKLFREQAADVLQPLASDSGAPAVLRAPALWGLGQLGTPEATRLLADLIADSGEELELRSAAVMSLRDGNTLAAVVENPELPKACRDAAVDPLVKLRDPRSINVLFTLIKSSMLDSWRRVDYLKALASFSGDPRACQLLCSLMHHPEVGPSTLVRLLIHDCVDVTPVRDALYTIANDQRLGIWLRLEAATGLAVQAGVLRHTVEPRRPLAKVSQYRLPWDDGLEWDFPWTKARQAGRMRDARGVDLLFRFATDRGQPGTVRLWAAYGLAMAHDVRTASVLLLLILHSAEMTTLEHWDFPEELVDALESLGEYADDDDLMRMEASHADDPRVPIVAAYARAVGAVRQLENDDPVRADDIRYDALAVLRHRVCQALIDYVQPPKEMGDGLISDAEAITRIVARTQTDGKQNLF